jgi:integrase
MPLTDKALRALKPAEKPYKTADGEGLYIHVMPNGSKLWRMSFRSAGKQQVLSFGKFPEVSLQEARDRRREARDALRAGRDPRGGGGGFAALAAEYCDLRRREGVAPATDAKNRWLAELLGDLGPVDRIEAPTLLEALRRIERRGCHETARRARSFAGRVFRYAIATGHARRDPAADLRDALAAPRVEHRAARFDPAEIGAMLRAIRSYKGVVVRNALLLGLYTMLRPGEVRAARWSEVSGDVWRVPSGRMKMRREHIVPLSRQALALLDELRGLDADLVFPSARARGRHLSENAMTAALRGMGIEDATPHGFRRTASTILNEQGWNRDWIERQLAHVEGNAVRAAYNAAEYLADRRRMLQSWADWLDGL